MSSNDLWYLARWLNNISIVNIDENSETSSNKRKRSGTGLSMATDSGYAGDADGELLSSSIPSTKTSKKEKLQDEVKI